MVGKLFGTIKPNSAKIIQKTDRLTIVLEK